MELGGSTPVGRASTPVGSVVSGKAVQRLVQNKGLQKGAKWLVSFPARSNKLDIHPKRYTAILNSISIGYKVSPVCPGRHMHG